MTVNARVTESEMIVRHIAWLRVYCVELNILEQPGMPMERHQKIMALRNEAPHFFWLMSSLIKDAIILGLDSLLDGDKGGRQLTLEHVVKQIADHRVRDECHDRLEQIRKGPVFRELSIARNHLIAHPNRNTLLRRDQMSVTADFPNLTISGLEEIVREITAIASLALGKPQSEFWFEDWEGVGKLFDILLRATQV